MSTRATLRLGRLAGIELRVSASWAIVFVLVVWSLGWGFFPDELPDESRPVHLAMAVVAALAFFASIVVHELAHSLMARRLGIGVESITLFLFGGVATISDEARRPRDEFLIAVVGPLASLGLGAALIGADIGLGALDAPEAVTAVCGYLGFINVLLAAFNMLPGFPLDGGRVLRAGVWAATGDLGKATSVAAGAGRLLGFGMIALGAFEVVRGNPTGLWFVVLGWFVIGAATGGQRQTMARQALSRVTAAELMTPNPLGVEPDASLAEAAELFERFPFAAYPVRDLLRPVGLVTLEDIEGVDRARWADTPVSAVMLPLTGHVVAPEDPVLGLLPRLRAGARLLVVDSEGDLRGILAPSDLAAWLGRTVRPRAA